MILGLSAAGCGRPDAVIGPRERSGEEPGGESPVEVLPGGELHVTHFFPPNYVRDGSVSYWRQIETAIKRVAGTGRPLIFPPMVYLVDRPEGLELQSDLVLRLEGAVFRTSRSFERDGQVFRGFNLRNVHISGGEIAGTREAWPDTVNVAGIRVFGESSGITIENLYVHDVSSNAVGIFGEDPRRMTRGVAIRGLRAVRCCNHYIDYLEPNPGPLVGTDTEDQGEIAMYFVKDFRVEDCVLEDSRSDGTHFYRCEDGEIVKNQIIGAKMGGYFIEWCTNVRGRENVVRASGSRGASLEYGSVGCTFENNLVEFSGREGCWVNDNIDARVTNNTFRENGRKNDHYVSCSILLTDTSWPDPSNPRSRNVRISGNTIHTVASQWAAIRIASCAVGVVVEGNVLTGENRVIRAEAWMTGVGQVTVRDNVGWRTENSGVAVFSANGNQRVFLIPHGLDVGDARVRVHSKVSMDSPDAMGTIVVGYNMTSLRITYAAPPPAGNANVRLSWTATLGSGTL